MGPRSFGFVNVSATTRAAIWGGDPGRLSGLAMVSAPARAAQDISWDALDPRFQYGGEVLELACAAVAGLRRGRLRHIRALGEELVKLPKVRVELTASPSGRVIRGHLRARRWGIAKNGIAQGVLPIPVEEADYLRRASRIVRRQAARATTLGITCEGVAPSERDELIGEMTPLIEDMPLWVGTLPDRPADRWWVARDASGAALAFAIVVVDRDWALLELLRSVDHTARYVLHTAIVEALRREQVSYLLTDNPMVLRMDPERRAFQRLLGYRVAHLRL